MGFLLTAIGGKSSTISENEATEMEATQEDSKETPRITIQRSRREMAQHNLSLANSDGNNTSEYIFCFANGKFSIMVFACVC